MKNPIDSHLFALVLVGFSIFCASCSKTSTPDLINPPDGEIQLISADTSLLNWFNWAKTTSTSFVGDDADPVGPWYEAALPGREAFCIRDISHQSIGAEILGQGKQNLNMFRKFAENISEEKDFCTYWEINRYNEPAPVDYRNDDDFWYNLNASFDIIDACWKLYQWTGNQSYIQDSVFVRFFKLTLHEYVDRCQLRPKDIMDRPASMNLKADTRKYRLARGIPSYDEQQEDISVSGDLIGMIYNAFNIYAKMLRFCGESGEALYYENQASAYRKVIDSLWWDHANNTYFGFYKKTDDTFYPGGISNSEFLLWYGVIELPERIVASLRELQNSQVEVLSYLPMLFYRYGYVAEGYDFLRKIYADDRRMYPEASAGLIEGIVRGMMGIEPLASENRIITCPKLKPEFPSVTVQDVPVFSGKISVHHASNTETVLANRAGLPFSWRALFYGTWRAVKVNNKVLVPHYQKDQTGREMTYIDVEMPVGSQQTVAVSN